MYGGRYSGHPKFGKDPRTNLENVRESAGFGVVSFPKGNLEYFSYLDDLPHRRDSISVHRTQQWVQFWMLSFLLIAAKN